MQAFASADLHLLTTRQEGFGKVLLEGMVHATVPIFADSPVAQEVDGRGVVGAWWSTRPTSVRSPRRSCALVADRAGWAAVAAAARAYAAR